MSEATQYSHKEVETKWIENWLSNELFACQINENRGKFSIALPPPNVTGELHMGHALSGTIQDILIRYNRMKSKDVLWQIGTDHAGIGTQIVVEKDLKKTEHKRKEDIGREAFIERTKAWKEDYGNRIIEQMKLLGFSPDYSRVRYTMDDHYADAVKKTFIKYFNDGKIYRGKRIVNWCPKCLTSLSDLELDKQACNKQLYDIKYQIKDSQASLTVSTTRPETMFGDTAIAINPSDERYSELINALKTDPDSIKALIPFTGIEIPVLLDEHVKTDFGSGAMKVTPAHDANDFDIAQRHNLARPVIMTEKAAMSDSDLVPDYLRGLDRYKARDLIVEKLEASGALVEVSEYDQEKDLHDRCATEIEPYLSDQWYVSMKELAKTALETEASGQSRFVPERYATTFKVWLENIQDWCISRQIWWGHQIPVYYYDDENGEEQTYAAEEPRDANHRQDPDVLDTWFSSALWPFETLKSANGSLELTDWDKKVFENFYPTSVLATAREIINLWVSRMIFSSQYLENKEPFSDILIHPVVQTPDGKRMSKSKGNAIDPLELIEKYGADASRMWYASVGVHGQQDVKFPGRKDKIEGWSSDQVDQYRKFANKLFNATRYVLMQLGDDFKAQPIESLDLNSFNAADTWITDKFANLLEELETAFGNYDFALIQKSLYSFLWFDFCDWYIELSKSDTELTATTKQILFHILETCLRALHPIMPFITEDLWQHLRSEISFDQIDNSILDSSLDAKYQASISFAIYPGKQSQLKDKADAAKQMTFVIQVISSLRNIRQSLGVSWSSPIKLFVKTSSEFERNAIQNSISFINNIAKTESVEFTETEVAKPASINLLGETQLMVPLAGLVDLTKLKVNIEKKIDKLKTDINVLEKRLGSDNFVKNAAADKVEETRALLEDCFNQKSLFEQELTALT
ncbi:MAG: valine--tRNA ligase [Candidatus Melainabacteria bacterium]|jgi:valyl-tRNA synthetase|nr:valine--tRNA ligase [Candidatus Melainabacteria bacterium]